MITLLSKIVLSFLLSLDNEIMAANPFFSGRIPQSLLDAVEKHQQSTGESKTKILTNALLAYLGMPSESLVPTVDSSRLEVLESRLARVEQVLSELQPQPATTTKTEQRLELGGQLSLDNIQSVEVEEESKSDNADNSIDNNRNDTDVVITSENSDNKGVSELWTTSQVQERLEVNRRTFERWDQRGVLPRTVKGYTIIRKAGQQKIGTRLQNAWEVCKDRSSQDTSLSHSSKSI